MPRIIALPLLVDETDRRRTPLVADILLLREVFATVNLAVSSVDCVTRRSSLERRTSRSSFRSHLCTHCSRRMSLTRITDKPGSALNSLRLSPWYGLRIGRRCLPPAAMLRRGIRCACTACFCRRPLRSGAPLWPICATLMPLPRVPSGRIYGSHIPCWLAASQRRNVPVCCHHKGAILTSKRFMMTSTNTTSLIVCRRILPGVADRHSASAGPYALVPIRSAIG